LRKENLELKMQSQDALAKGEKGVEELKHKYEGQINKIQKEKEALAQKKGEEHEAYLAQIEKLEKARVDLQD